MRIGIFSDVHGNSEALETVIKAMEKEKVDRVFCVGDLVGYGPEPDRCVSRVRSYADGIVAGNHDQATTGQISTANFNAYAREAIEWTQTVVSTQTVEYLRHLPLSVTENDVMLVHATPENPEAWDYILSVSDAHRSFEALHMPICFVGHSHVPAAYVRDSEHRISVREASDVSIEDGKNYIINVGSVGQPRDGDPRACYGVLDTDERRFRLKRLDYPVETVQKKMRRAGLPAYLIYRLSWGH